MLLRSFAVQGSWNYQTLIGTGFAFVLFPVLRRLHREDPEALRSALSRHLGLFNSHPYLASLAAGAVARMEYEGADPQTVERFKAALRGSLGAIGDQLFWSAWRPTVALLAIALLLVGAPWWAAVGVFLVVYNTLHLWVRAWGLTRGLREGVQIAATLRRAPLALLARRTADAGAFLAGACAVLLAAGAGPGPGGLLLGAAAIAAGFVLGTRTRLVVWGGLSLVWGGAVAASMFIS